MTTYHSYRGHRDAGHMDGGHVGMHGVGPMLMAGGQLRSEYYLSHTLDMGEAYQCQVSHDVTVEHTTITGYVDEIDLDVDAWAEIDEGSGEQQLAATVEVQYRSTIDSPADEAAPGPPSPPVPLRIQLTPGDRAITASWLEPIDKDFTHYVYRITNSSGRYSSWTKIPGSDVDTLSHTFRDLSNGQRYYILIAAANGTTIGASSHQAHATPNGDRVVAEKGVVRVSTLTPIKIKLSRQPTADVVVTLELPDGWHHSGQTRPTRTFTTANWNVYQAVTMETYSRVSTGDSGTANISAPGYTAARVRLIAGGTDAVPGRVLINDLVAEDNHRVDISWDDLDDPSITEWHVRTRLSTDTEWRRDEVVSVLPAATHARIELLDVGTHYVQMRARNAVGFCPWSDLHSVTIVDPPGAEWTDWEEVDDELISARAVQVRVILTRQHADVSLALTEVGAELHLPARTLTGKNIGGGWVYITPQFALPPSVVSSIGNPSSVQDDRFYLPSWTGRVYDWVAHGFGEQVA